MYDNFVKYQGRLHKVFQSLHREYGFYSIQAGRSMTSIAREIRGRVEKILASNLAEKASASPKEPREIRDLHEPRESASAPPATEKSLAQADPSAEKPPAPEKQKQTEKN
jgi:hypothetical protein